MSVRPQTPMRASIEARIAEFASAPTSPLPPPSPLTLLSSPLPQIPSPPLLVPSPPTHTSPTYAEAPLGYRAAGIRLRASSPPLLLSPTIHRTDIPEAELPPRKRLCLTGPALRFEVGESSAAAAARHAGPALARDDLYKFVDTLERG
ncbi:hypothetical protein Tco_1357835 [Tanacetum coccineum]